MGSSRDTQKVRRDPETGQYLPVGRTSSKRSTIHGLGDRSITAEQMQPMGLIDLSEVKKELETKADLKSKLRVLDPETAIKTISHYGSHWFGHEFGPERQFLQVRYHLGTSLDEWEFHSKGYPYELDSWSVMEHKIVDHMRTKFSELDPDIIKETLLRIIFFHNPAVYDSTPKDPDSEQKNVCRAPIDFAFSLMLTVDEFVNYHVFRKPLQEFRFSFDANYYWRGNEEKTLETFSYVENWDFYSKMLQSFGELLGRPLTSSSAPVSLLEEHCGTDLPPTIVSLATVPKNAWSDEGGLENRGAVFYSPRVDASFNEQSTTITFYDDEGLLKMHAADLEQRDFVRRINGNLIEFEKKY